MTETIHLVVGRSGEYEDRSTWVVAAYRDSLKAQHHCAKAFVEAQRLTESLRRRWDEVNDDPSDLRTPRRGRNRYDPQDDGADGYSVVEVQLLEEVPG